MRIERSINTVSWIPSDLMEGMGKMATRMKLAHHDPPPPDSLGTNTAAAIEELRMADRFRFANELRGYIDVGDEGRITDFGYCGGGVIGATTIGHGASAITIPAIKLPDRQADPVATDWAVTFTQTVGGRTGAPMPRPVKHAPFIQYRAPIVWTTLQLTIRADSSHEGTMIGASGFPRHWLFDDTGSLVAKSSVAEYKQWMSDSFGRRTPWGDEDSPALMTHVESALERSLQDHIMRGDHKPDIRRVRQGRVLVEQGASSNEMYLLLNGVLVVEVDDAKIAELGPGAVFGERAVLEGSTRTATLRAVTDCKVAAISVDRMDLDKLAELAGSHRREGAHG